MLSPIPFFFYKRIPRVSRFVFCLPRGPLGHCHPRMLSLGVDADHTATGVWIGGAVTVIQDSRRAGRTGPIRPDRHDFFSACSAHEIGPKANLNALFLFLRTNNPCSFLSVPLAWLRCSLLVWSSDLNTEQESRRGNEGQAPDSPRYDWAKVCSAFDVVAPQLESITQGIQLSSRIPSGGLVSTTEG